MLQTGLSSVLGVLFVLVGAFNVWLIFHSSSRLKDRGASARLIRGHRIGGYIFIILFCVMIYFMVLRLRDMPEEMAARSMLHMLLAMLMVPLLFVKVLIARYYKTYYSVLTPLGLIIFSLSFVLVTMTVGPYLLRKATIKDISLASIDMGTNQIDVESAQTLMQRRCAMCHNLDRVVGARKDAEGWLATVNRMRTLPGANISENDATTILSYLVSQVGIDNSTPKGETMIGKALVDSRCNRCHDLDRVYKSAKTAEDWASTVGRMVTYAPDGFLGPGEDQEVVKFLSATQTAEAVQARSEKAVATAAAVSAGAPAVKPPPIKAVEVAGGSNLKTLAVISFFGLFFGALMLRRPSSSVAALAAAMPAISGKAPQPLAPDPKKAVINLQLARIEQQTSDARTLRFLVPEGQRFFARPGQFLTFNWIVEGKKVVRSYSICSSPTQTGYVEITPKRVEDGCVSIFLNDKAMIGLTVEAKGPSGQFVFDEVKHKKIVLIAAGSGITPMVSILRYIDDRCLSTDATLLYSVRTRSDIIFEKELASLKTRLESFRYAVTLSKPDAEWKGPKGRLSRELIQDNVKDLATSTFFLCGPKAFMEGAKNILLSLGVDDARIKQESFGGAAATFEPAAKSEGVEGRVEFARSRKTCDIPAGRPLLEVAEMNGIPIPFSCRQGQCGTCATRLLDGEVNMDAEDGLDPDLKAEGYVLTCCGHAQGNVKLDA
jgi:ferredoxin-NADP reductase